MVQITIISPRDHDDPFITSYKTREAIAFGVHPYMSGIEKTF
ncbi:MAG: hypothetical protein KA716_33240 [Gloeotrichia echinulata DEX184]